MTTKIDRVRDAVAVLLQTSNPQDEFSLTTFANQPTVVQDITSNANDIRSQLPFTSPKGSTSLIDAIVLFISQMRKARHQRKVMVIISDVGDNRTHYSEKDVKSLIKDQTSWSIRLALSIENSRRSKNGWARARYRLSLSRQSGRGHQLRTHLSGKQEINFSTVFADRAVGIKEVHHDIWLISYLDDDLGYFDLDTRVLEPLDNPFRPRLSPM
jgi:Mg-chelatase subunit ChlD